MSDSVKWLHPASVLQTMLEGTNHHNYFQTVYTLTLCSVHPLQHDQVKQALTHLLRKVPSLKLCLRRRDGRLWACQMDHENIDFKVVKADDADQVTETLGRHNYNVSEGPLWCVRLVSNEKNLEAPREELQDTFPHNQTLCLAVHHSMADGTANTQTINFFLQILNDVISGKDVDDTKPLGEYKGAEEIDNLINIQDKNLEKDPERLSVLLKEYKDGDKKEPLLCKVHPPIQGVPSRTKFIKTMFDLDTSRKFIQACKSNGITVNSGFIALLNATIVEYLRIKGLEQEMYPIKSGHTINMRRYLPKDMCDILGPHTSLLRSITMTPGNFQDSFWDYAKQVHQDFYKDLEYEPITFLCLTRKAYYYEDSFKEVFSKPHPPAWDYITATMGNLDVRIPTEGDHVRLGHVLRMSTNAFDPLMQMYHSFRGRFCYSLSYSTNLLTTETAKHLVDLLAKNLKSQV